MLPAAYSAPPPTNMITLAYPVRCTAKVMCVIVSEDASIKSGASHATASHVD